MEVDIFGVSGTPDMIRFTLNWDDPERGFGQIEFRKYSDKESVVIDSELMSRDFIKSVLNALVDKARVIGEPLDKT